MQLVLPEQMVAMVLLVQLGLLAQQVLLELMERTDATERQARLVQPGKTAQWVPPDH